MKMLIDTCDVVPAEVAAMMIAQVADREDGVHRFSKGYEVEVKTTKTQRVFKVMKSTE